MRKKKPKLILNKCELDFCNETVDLHLHHHVERTEENTTNNPWNLCILCPNCHAKIHSGSIKVIGVFPSTQLPNGRTLVYEMNGVKNLDINHSYIEFKNKSYRIFPE